MSSPAVQIRTRVPRPADTALTKARLRVVPRARTRAPRVPFVVLVSALLVAGVVGLLLFNTSMQQVSFTTSRLEAQASALSAREQALLMQVEELHNPQRVAEAAQGMGMVLPARTCFLTLQGPQQPCAADPADRATPLRLHPAPPVKPAILDPPPVHQPPARGTRAGDASRDTASASPGRGAGQGRNGTEPDRARR